MSSPQEWPDRELEPAELERLVDELLANIRPPLEVLLDPKRPLTLDDSYAATVAVNRAGGAAVMLQRAAASDVQTRCRLEAIVRLASMVRACVCK